MAWNVPINKNLIKVGLAVLAWVLVGAVFYWAIGNCSEVPRLTRDGVLIEDYVICPWRFSHAFYWSVQTGMSIGFGLLSESEKASELYSCFHILAGSSFIGGALSFFVALMLTKHRDFLSTSEQRLVKACVALHADGYHGLTLTQIREMMLMHPQYANALIRKVYPTPAEAAEQVQEFSTGSPSARREAANRILKEACEKVDCFKNGNVMMTDLLKIDEENASLKRKVLRALRAKENFIRVTCAWVAWITLGALFSCFGDGNDAITSIYFAISALSTAGIVATKTVESDAHVIFVGFFCLIGVPLYAFMLGSFANLLTERYMEQQTTTKLNTALTTAESAFLAHLAGADGNSEVDLAEYTELQLLRLGVVDRDTLNMIKDHFRKLDRHNEGRLKVSAFVHPHHLDKEKAGAAAAPSTPQAAPAGGSSPNPDESLQL